MPNTPQKPTTKSPEPLVSVIVPTYNRANYLESCIKTVVNSNYTNLEIIVIDDNSTDDTSSAISKYKSITYIRNNSSKYLIYNRNLGAKLANGKYILFIDDDNEIDPDMITNLVEHMEKYGQVSVAGPLTLYASDPGTIWWCATKINEWTGKTLFPHRNESRLSVTDSAIHTQGIPNCFMIRESKFDKNKIFDDIYIDGWTESDFCQRAINNGDHVVCVTSSITYHKVSKNDFRGITLRSIGDNPQKAYTYIRNRFIFFRRYSSRIKNISFMFVAPLITMMYCYYAVRLGNLKYVKYYIEGHIDGLRLFFASDIKEAANKIRHSRSYL